MTAGLVLACFACGPRDAAAPPERASGSRAEVEAPPPPPPVPPPTGRSIVRTVRPWTMAGVTPDAERFVELARQRAAECYARTPDPSGVMELVISLDEAGRVTEVVAERDELGNPMLMRCLQQSIGAMRGLPAVVPIPLPTISVSWRFETIPVIDVERDCITDAECGLVIGVCGELEAVRRAVADDAQAARRARAAVATCGARVRAPAFARCVEGYCTAVPADMDDMRDCRRASDCAVFERGCGHDVVAASRRAEAESIVRPTHEGLVCPPRPEAPAPVCASGFCTLEWAPSAPP